MPIFSAGPGLFVIVRRFYLIGIAVPGCSGITSDHENQWVGGFVFFGTLHHFEPVRPGLPPEKHLAEALSRFGPKCPADVEPEDPFGFL